MELSAVALLSLFSTLNHVCASHPTARDVCLLQVDEGPCRGDVGRFYYNTISQKCEEFSYGGCQGNDNNFITFEECQKTCWKIPKVPQICRFRKDVGPCRAMHLRYHYNMTSMQCEPFYYGGCQGNDNRFSDHQSCMDYCRPHKRTSVLCLDPLDKGRCAASIPRYYYNTVTRMCEQFMYSGCGGSSNNFVSRQSCLDVCGKGNRPRKNKHRGNRTMKRKPINFVQY